VQRHQVLGGAVFDGGINSDNEEGEVTTIGGGTCATHESCQRPPPKPRPRRQPHPCAGEPSVKGGIADEKTLIQPPALVRFTERREFCPHPAYDHVLLRHRPRSISRRVAELLSPQSHGFEELRS